MNNARPWIKRNPWVPMALSSIKPEDVGRIARVRQRQYQVEDVRTSDGSPSTIVRLSGIDGDNLGRPLEVIWEQELDAELANEDRGLLAGRGFDPPDRFSA